MKKSRVVTMVMATGILLTGALSASAADSCGRCAQKESVQQFNKETAALHAELKAMKIELSNEYSYNAIDINRVNAIEVQIRGIKEKIDASANRYGISACSRG